MINSLLSLTSYAQSSLRPVLDSSAMSVIRDNLMYSETELFMPASAYTDTYTSIPHTPNTHHTAPSSSSSSSAAAAAAASTSVTSIKLRFFTAADKHGTHALPEVFYSGVIFGISANNSHALQASPVSD